MSLCGRDARLLSIVSPRQIISYLTTHAHPQMRKNVSVLPSLQSGGMEPYRAF